MRKRLRIFLSLAVALLCSSSATAYDFMLVPISDTSYYGPSKSDTHSGKLYSVYVYDYLSGSELPSTAKGFGIFKASSTTNSTLTASDLKTLITTEDNNKNKDEQVPSDLLSRLTCVVIKSSTSIGGTTEDWKNFINDLSPNALLLVDKDDDNVLQGLDNAAKLNTDGTYTAYNNIVIEDMEPFFVPFTVSTTSDHFIQYTRKGTPTQSKYNRTTLVLPFSVNLSNGTCTTSDGGTLTFYQMNSDNFLSATNTEDNYGQTFTANFTKVSDESTTANLPYMVEVKAGNQEASGVLYTIQETGASIVPSPKASYDNNDYNMKDGYIYPTNIFKYDPDAATSTASGTIKEGNYSFTFKGTYVGGDDFTNVFYYSKGYLFSSNNYPTKKVIAFPFRTFFAYSGSNSAKLFQIAAGFTDGESTTGISNTKLSGLTVTPTSGGVELTADRQTNVCIYAPDGTVVRDIQLRPSETQRIALPKGLYVIDKTKVIVK